jgi:DNA-binding MarR family transcriptional regulator
MSPLLKRLETAGLFSEKRGKKDEREVQIALTAARRELQKKSGEVANGIVCLMELSLAETQKLQKALRGTVDHPEPGWAGGRSTNLIRRTRYTPCLQRG